jgi:hypothetical protein
MPTDARQYFYQCTRCGILLKPKAGDCCVFCSYGTVKCPPKQVGGVDCRCAPRSAVVNGGAPRKSPSGDPPKSRWRPTRRPENTRQSMSSRKPASVDREKSSSSSAARGTYTQRYRLARGSTGHGKHSFVVRGGFSPGAYSRPNGRRPIAHLGYEGHSPTRAPQNRAPIPAKQIRWRPLQGDSTSLRQWDPSCTTDSSGVAWSSGTSCRRRTSEESCPLTRLGARNARAGTLSNGP